MNNNWQPGHMKMTRDLLKAKLKIVDIVIELIDARAPLSSKNPEQVAGMLRNGWPQWSGMGGRNQAEYAYTTFETPEQVKNTVYTFNLPERKHC